jgi:SulP family sulfate permease
MPRKRRYTVLLEELTASLVSLPATALRSALKEGYGRAQLQADLMAGVVVCVVALPLSMALGIAVGVPPQHGLYTAIVAGFLVSLLGGSRTQVTGPTAAFVVILAPIYVHYGLAGLLLAGMMAGVMLVGLALARMGRLLQFIPHPVTTGFTAGIAVVIATLQLKDLLGLTVPHMPEHYLERVEALALALPTASFQELGVGLATLLMLVYVPRLTQKVPAPLIAIGVAAAGATLLHHFSPGFDVHTIRSQFHTLVAGQNVDGIPQVPPMPVLPWHLAGPGGQPFHLSLQVLRDLLPAAFAICMLGAIESLLSAVVSDGMAGTRHDPDAELLALGIGNMVVPFFGGIAATGAIARTATNIRSGGRTPVASASHALMILLAVLALAPLLGYIPMASLAALLLRVAWNMSEAKHFVHTVRVAPRSDVIVLLTCFSLTVIFDMVVGVSVGVTLAALLFMRRMAEVTRAEVLEGPLKPGVSVPQGVLVYDIAGPLFFGAAEKAMGALNSAANDAKVVVLELDQVHAMDATGLVALESALASLEKTKRFAIISGLQAQPAQVLARAELVDVPGKLVFCPNLEAALTLASQHLGARPPSGAQARVQPEPQPQPQTQTQTQAKAS